MRRDHHLGAITVRRDRLIYGIAIIRAVRRHLANWIVNLIEQRADLGRIVDVLIRQRLRHGHVASRIHRQMELAPHLAGLRNMPRPQPLTVSVDLQASAVDQHLQTNRRHFCWLMTGNVTTRGLTVL